MTEQLTTTSIISLFHTNKEERASFVNDVISKLESGEADSIKVHLQIKCMESIIKDLNDNKDYRSMLLVAAEKNGKKFTAYNSEFSIKEVGTKYDYSNTGDIEYSDLEKQSAEISDKLKARQKFLQTISVAGIDIITSDGEPMHIYPPSKSSTTAVAVTLK